MVWGQTGNRSLPEQIMIQVKDAQLEHQTLVADN